MTETEKRIIQNQIAIMQFLLGDCRNIEMLELNILESMDYLKIAKKKEDRMCSPRFSDYEHH